VTATDISAAMAGEAERRYREAVASGSAAPPPVAPTFEAKCLEDVEGTYDVVCCIDVLIHYPQEKVDEMVLAVGWELQRAETAQTDATPVQRLAPSGQLVKSS
jgi:2-polyprenyl-3-methyl-5-hydroxy-6-metoxy-1,4-benzoquinol methylase